MSLDDIAAELEQSKSNVSVQIRGLVEWHLVRRVAIGGSRKDHYQAATDFWRVMQEIFERRYRFNVRQVLMAVDESARAAEMSPAGARGERGRAEFMAGRLAALRTVFSLLDSRLASVTPGTPPSPGTV